MRKDEGVNADEEADEVIDVTEQGAEVVDLQRDPAPPLPEQIELPREVVLSELRDVQEFSFRRRLWGKAFRFVATETTEPIEPVEPSNDPQTDR